MPAAVLVLLAVTPAAHQPPPAGLYGPKGGGYTVVFPDRPKDETKSVKTAAGELKVHTATYATADGYTFLASHTDFPAGAVEPADLPKMYDRVAEQLKGKDGKLVSNKDVTVGATKWAAREVVIDRGKQQARFRLVAKGDRLLQLAAVGPGPFVTGAEATAFLDSLKLEE